MLAGLMSAWTLLQSAMKVVSAYRFVKGATGMFGKLMGIGPWKIGLIVALVVGVGSSVYVFKSHYEALVNSKVELAAEVAQKETALAVQKAMIDAQQTALDEWVQFQAGLQVKLQELADGQAAAKAERDKLAELFDKHDLGLLLDTKPNLILSRVNDGIARSLRLLECASGATGPDCDSKAGGEAVITVAPKTGAY